MARRRCSLSSSNSQVTTIKKTGGGTYDPNARGVYFFATGVNILLQITDICPHLLIAVNELKTDKEQLALNTIFNQVKVGEDGAPKGNKVFLDSGVFNLAQEHAKRYGVSHDKSLLLQPDEVDDFSTLYDRYITLVRKHEEQLWGYVEIDLGGRDTKRETRAKLEAEGLRPIPVYHPLNDGWDYFDELASQYDRICVGNVVQASRYIRKRIIATIFERKQAYPHLWIHLLGYTPDQWMLSYPMESCDSSSWLVALRWYDSWRERAALRTVSKFTKGYAYQLGSNNSHYHAVRLSAQQFEANRRNWFNYQEVFSE